MTRKEEEELAAENERAMWASIPKYIMPRWEIERPELRLAVETALDYDQEIIRAKRLRWRRERMRGLRSVEPRSDLDV